MGSRSSVVSVNAFPFADEVELRRVIKILIIRRMQVNFPNGVLKRFKFDNSLRA